MENKSIKCICSTFASRYQQADYYMRRRNIIFIGSFKTPTAGENLGGQMFACRTLVDSYLSEFINFIQIDTTVSAEAQPNKILRIPLVISRFIKLIFHLFFSKVDKALIFTCNGTSFMEKGLMALVCKLFKKEVILAPRCGMIIDDIQKNGLQKKYIKYVVSKSDYIICQSNYWKEVFEKLISTKNENKFIIQPNWINEKAYLENLLDYDTKMHDDQLSIIFIGWLEKYKGITDLIHAAKILKEYKDKIKFEIYGSGDSLEEIKKLIAEFKLSDMITLKGWANQEKKFLALRKAHIYILPSRKEGFPNALLEAMVSELPVIATDVGAVPDIIKNYENGIITPSEKPEDLASNLKTLIEDAHLRKRLAKNAKISILSTYTIEKSIDNFKSLLVS